MRSHDRVAIFRVFRFLVQIGNRTAGVCSPLRREPCKLCPAGVAERPEAEKSPRLQPFSEVAASAALGSLGSRGPAPQRKLVKCIVP